jgi:hypothetical protein
VWLRVKRCTNPNQLINGFRVDIGGEDSGRSELAKGAGGKYRYLGS